jgi:hypothetical protein
MSPTHVGAWAGNWAWGVSLIVLTVMIHVCGLALIGERVVRVMGESIDRSRFLLKFALVMGGTSLLATGLHGIEAAIWAAAYIVVGAVPVDVKLSMLYSISAITAYGHAEIYLQSHWQLMGALEALNGMLLFGLTTAFMFAMIQRVWPLGSRHHSQES